MDASFDPTVAGAGWDDGTGNFATSTQAHGSANSFDRIPLPVQIKDIMGPQLIEDKIHFGPYAFGTLRVCGRIAAKDEQEKETQLELSDPSGDFGDSLKVVVYQSAQTPADYNINDVIVALGKVRQFAGTISFVAFGVIVQGDPRMAETFKLEAQLAKLFYSNNVPDRAQVPCSEFEGTMLANTPFVRGNQAAAGGATQPTGYTANAAFNPGASQGAKYKNEPSFSDSNRGLSGLKEKIFNAIHGIASDGETGVHVNDILRTVGPNAPTFQADLQYLVNEGVIYNTIDDDHFAAI